MADWKDWIGKLEGAAEDHVDNVVDELAELLLVLQPDPNATLVAIKALAMARSDLSIRSAAAALSFVASNDCIEAVELLEQRFDASRQHVFLGPSLLGSLTLLGLRSESARAGAVRYLQRLQPTEQRPLLVAGAKAMGLLCDRENDEKLRAKLFALSGIEDISVKAEARQQVALIRLADALLADSHESMIASFTASREAFRVAEASEEVRPDATLFRLLLDAVLEFDEIERDRDGALQRIERQVVELRKMGGRAAEHIFQMDRAPAASQIAHRCEIVALAIEAAAKETASVARWTNFDKSVVRLAECYGYIRYRPCAMPGYEQTGQAINGFADRVLKTRLGPILLRKVGRESFAEVVRNYEAEGGNSDVLIGLRELQRAALEAERAGKYNLSEQSVGTLSKMAEKAGCSTDELITQFNLKISVNGGDGFAVAAELLPPAPGKRGKKMPLPTIGIIVAITEEFDAIRSMITNEERYRAPGPGGSREYLIGDIPSVRKGIHQIVLAQAMDMGNTSAALRASKMLMDFDGLEHIIMCGIAGGVPHPEQPEEHVRLGDVVVSNRKGVIQYDFGKQKGKVFEERFAPRPPSASLLEAVHMLEQDRLVGHSPWNNHLSNGLIARALARPNLNTDVLFDDKGESIEHPVINADRPRVFLGPIASANVVQGDFRKRDQLRDEHKVKAIEMEGYGVADATWEYEKAGYLVIRGICDYCDVRTKHLQTDTWKRYAAFVAAAYTRALVEAMPGLSR